MNDKIKKILFELSADFTLTGIQQGRKSLHDDKALCLKVSKLRNAIDLLSLQRAQLTRCWEGVSITSIVETVKECLGAAFELGSFLGNNYPAEYVEIELHGTRYVEKCWALIGDLSV